MKSQFKPQNKNPSAGGKFIANIFLLLLSTVLTLFAVETVLRLMGKKPGYVPRYSRFKFVQRLEVDSSFCTDSEGVFKANRYYRWTDEISINSDGFRSDEFTNPPPANKRKILFLGDSFAWGSSARPITKCFVDLIRQRGFVTFNTGIPGTDTNQYAYLAEKYATPLKPDIVAVMIYLGNDFIAPRPMLPFKNLYHVTNARFLYAFDDKGNYMTPQEAYQYYAAKSNAAAEAQNREDDSFKSTLRQLLMKTVTGTYLWVSGKVVKQSMFTGVENDTTKRLYDQARKSLRRIQAAANKVGARFMLFVIPVHPLKKNPFNSVQYHLDFLNEFNAYIPDFLEESDYMKLPNAHFNNSGHRKYADFILKALEDSKGGEVKLTNGG